MLTLTPDQMKLYTARNPYDRFEDGRPRIDDAILSEARQCSSEDAWAVLYASGYQNQFDGDWQILRPETTLVGRAVTAQFMPFRPDLNDALRSEDESSLQDLRLNQRIIETLKPDDVLVVDLFGKREGGTFAGEMLATSVYAYTHAGMVVDGALRDLSGIKRSNAAAYCRSTHPTPLHQVLLTGLNIPVRIGPATVLPGDLVLGDNEGVTFVPPELVEQVIQSAHCDRVYESWIKVKAQSEAYRFHQLYPEPRGEALQKDFSKYREENLK